MDLWKMMGMMEVDTGSAWLRKVTLVLDQDAKKPGFHGPHKVSGEERTSDNGMLRWSPADPDGAWCSLNTPGAKLLIGHVGGRSFSTGDDFFDVSPRPWPGKLPAYACISLVALDGKPIDCSSRMLFVASARTENRNMGWNANRTSLSMEGGQGKGPSVSEAVPVKLHLPGNPVKAVKLDAKGRPAGELITSGNTVELRREDQSL